MKKSIRNELILNFNQKLYIIGEENKSSTSV